tara:strand:- start:240 stop:2303 length:2064 start_codon:yes stop_codon:yes gene_type:complete
MRRFMDGHREEKYTNTGNYARKHHGWSWIMAALAEKIEEIEEAEEAEESVKAPDGAKKDTTVELDVPEGGIGGFAMSEEDFDVLAADEAKKEFGESGLAQFTAVAKKMAGHGRFGDDSVAHIQTGEMVVPLTLLESNPALKAQIFKQLRVSGIEDPEQYVVGSKANSINPETGLMEFGFLSKVWRGVRKAVGGVVKVIKKVAPYVLPVMLSMTRLGPVYGAALGAGIGTLVDGGNAKEALRNSLYAGAAGAAYAGVTGGPSGIGDAFLRPGGDIAHPDIDPKWITTGPGGPPSEGGGGSFDAEMRRAKRGGGRAQHARDIRDEYNAQRPGWTDLRNLSPLHAAERDRRAEMSRLREESIAQKLTSATANDTYAPGDWQQPGEEQSNRTRLEELRALYQPPATSGTSDLEGYPIFQPFEPFPETHTNQDYKALTENPATPNTDKPPADAEKRSLFQTLQDWAVRGGMSRDDIVKAEIAAGKKYDSMTKGSEKTPGHWERRAEYIKKEVEPGLIAKYGVPAAASYIGGKVMGFFDTPEQEDPGLIARNDDGTVTTGSDLVARDPGKYLVHDLGTRRLDLATGEYVPKVRPSEDLDGENFVTRYTVPTDWPSQRPQHAADGGPIYPRRNGGVDPSEGAPGQDSVRAMLMPGEFVMTKEAVRGLGDGSLNNGIKSMYSVMRNLESRGRATA